MASRWSAGRKISNSVGEPRTAWGSLDQIGIDDALTGESFDQNLHRKDLVLPGRSLQV